MFDVVVSCNAFIWPPEIRALASPDSEIARTPRAAALRRIDRSRDDPDMQPGDVATSKSTLVKRSPYTVDKRRGNALAVNRQPRSG